MLQPLAETCGAIVDRKRPDPACATVKHDGELKLGIPDATILVLKSPAHISLDITIRAAAANRNLSIAQAKTSSSLFSLGFGERYGKIACPPTHSDS